jgi:hypothetical protein
VLVIPALRRLRQGDHDLKASLGSRQRLCLKKNFFFKLRLEVVAHACNPSYSGGRDQEDHSSKSAQASSSQDPISKKIHKKKRVGGVAQGVGPEFKPQYRKRKKKS